MLHRRQFNISDTGTGVALGYCQGYLHEVSFTSDTGGTIELIAHPDRADTGSGKLIFSGVATEGSYVSAWPRANDTGSTCGVRHGFAGDALTVKALAKGAATTTQTATVYVWFDEDA